MHNHHINLLKETTPLPAYQTYRSPAPRILVSCSVFLLLLTGTAVFSYQTARDESSALSKTWGAITSFPLLRNIAYNANSAVQIEGSERINVLLMGIGGEGHEGSYLTDTMILASVAPKTGHVALFSIPRDLLVPIDGYGWRKINNANAFGEMAQDGGGGELARKTVEQVFGVPVLYYLRVDFQAFADIIDSLGGITVSVDQRFTDYKYPTLNKKYQTVHFDAGEQEMNGQRALMFVRSRHSMDNNEGSDFARGRRQQKVISAVKEKLFSSALFFRPQKVAEILQALKDNVSTNMEVWQMLTLGNAVKKIQPRDMVSIVFDDGENGALVSETIDGAYVLRPRDGSFFTLQEKVKNVFATLDGSAPRDIGRGTRVIIRNGTTIDGLGGKTSALLKDYEFTVTTVENAKERAYPKTLIFDLSEKSRPDVKKFLSSLLKGETIYDPYSPELDSATSADFLIILGSDIPPMIAAQIPATSLTETTAPLQ